VVIGNPPYVEYSKVRKEYKLYNYITEDCGNLYAFVYERSSKICKNLGTISFIVPISGFSTERMRKMQSLLRNDSDKLFLSHYSGDRNPAELFTGVKNRLTIFISFRNNMESTSIFSTDYQKWYTEARPNLFPNLSYLEIKDHLTSTSIPKLGNTHSINILNKLCLNTTSMQYLLEKGTGSFKLYYNNTPIHWTKSYNFQPYFWNQREGEKLSTQLNLKSVEDEKTQSLLVSVFNSTLFYMFWVIYSDCYHLISRELKNFKIFNQPTSISDLCKILMSDLKTKSNVKTVNYKTTGKVKYQEIDHKKSKQTIDEIDKVLAENYSFTEEELDFIINYDIKYRMGKELNK